MDEENFMWDPGVGCALHEIHDAILSSSDDRNVSGSRLELCPRQK